MDDEVSAPGTNYSCIEDQIAVEMTTTIEGLRGGIVKQSQISRNKILWSFNRREPTPKSFMKEIL
jgi:hypothetical protein